MGKFSSQPHFCKNPRRIKLEQNVSKRDDSKILKTQLLEIREKKIWLRENDWAVFLMPWLSADLADSMGEHLALNP